MVRYCGIVYSTVQYSQPPSAPISQSPIILSLSLYSLLPHPPSLTIPFPSLPFLPVPHPIHVPISHPSNCHLEPRASPCPELLVRATATDSAPGSQPNRSAAWLRHSQCHTRTVQQTRSRMVQTEQQLQEPKNPSRSVSYSYTRYTIITSAEHCTRISRRPKHHPPFRATKASKPGSTVHRMADVPAAMRNSATESWPHPCSSAAGHHRSHAHMAKTKPASQNPAALEQGGERKCPSRPTEQ